MDTWPRAGQFRLFRTYARPQYAVTTRLDVTHVLDICKPNGMSPYRACLYAIGCGLHAVPELLMRFRGNEVVQHKTTALSMTVPTDAGSFTYAYVPFDPRFAEFDAQSADLIEQAKRQDGLGANIGQTDAVAYLSCMPWLDYTSINNAMPGPDDCIPRVSWGKFVREDDRWRMAMTLEVHHALVDGQQVGAYFETVQQTLDHL